MDYCIVSNHYTGLFHNKSVTGIKFDYSASYTSSTCHGTYNHSNGNFLPPTAL